MIQTKMSLPIPGDKARLPQQEAKQQKTEMVMHRQFGTRGDERPNDGHEPPAKATFLGNHPTQIGAAGGRINSDAACAPTTNIA